MICFKCQEKFEINDQPKEFNNRKWFVSCPKCKQKHEMYRLPSNLIRHGKQLYRIDEKIKMSKKERLKLRKQNVIQA